MLKWQFCILNVLPKNTTFTIINQVLYFTLALEYLSTNENKCISLKHNFKVKAFNLILLQSELTVRLIRNMKNNTNVLHRDLPRVPVCPCRSVEYVGARTAADYEEILP